MDESDLTSLAGVTGAEVTVSICTRFLNARSCSIQIHESARSSCPLRIARLALACCITLSAFVTTVQAEDIILVLESLTVFIAGSGLLVKADRVHAIEAAGETCLAVDSTEVTERISAFLNALSIRVLLPSSLAHCADAFRALLTVLRAVVAPAHVRAS